MNKYLRNLGKIEFVVTDACTGRCKHCSQGEHSGEPHRIDPTAAAELVRSVAAEYSVKTVMTFGGEPLLHPEAVYAIHAAACEMGVECRQLITNGYFSTAPDVIDKVVRRLADSGVNDLLLSVDAFHQETIPLDIVRAFAASAVKYGIPTRLQPAWLVSRDDENPYNLRTREILASFSDILTTVSDGNVIFPEGNAALYLAEYFGDVLPENPYIEEPDDLRCISIDAGGGLLGGNIYETKALSLLENYKPWEC